MTTWLHLAMRRWDRGPPMKRQREHYAHKDTPMYIRRWPAVCKGAAPWDRTPPHRSWRAGAHPQCSVSKILVIFQNINLLLIKGCLNPRKLLKYASILLIWETSNRLYKPAGENPRSLRKTKCSEIFPFSQKGIQENSMEKTGSCLCHVRACHWL